MFKNLLNKFKKKHELSKRFIDRTYRRVEKIKRAKLNWIG